MPQITNEVDVLVQDYIVPAVSDLVFADDPGLAFLKANRLNVHPGGRQIQEDFEYKPLIGGAYSKGETFDVTKRRTLDAAYFTLKNHYVNVTEFLEELNIEARGPNAVFSLLEKDLQVAAKTMAAILAIEFYGSDLTTNNKKINGLAEIASDGATASWDANTYTTYGGLTRSTLSSTAGKKLNARVASVSGPITYKLLEEYHNRSVLGMTKPNVGLTTNLGMSYIKQRFHPQYRVTQNDPTIGFNGIQFNNATILQSQYAPGTDGENDADLGNFNASAGETFFWLATEALRFWVADDKLFQFGFTGFKDTADSTIVSGQYLASVNVTCQQPRLFTQLYAITG